MVERLCKIIWFIGFTAIWGMIFHIFSIFSFFILKSVSLFYIGVGLAIVNYVVCAALIYFVWVFIGICLFIKGIFWLKGRIMK